MSRFIDVDLVANGLPDVLTIGVGDVVRFVGSGGRVQDGSAVEILGVFTAGVIGTDGRALSPMGPPNAVLIRAALPGMATINVVVGDPWHSPATRTLTIVVEA